MLLPEKKQKAMNAIYAFCRKTDDIVDSEHESKFVKQEKLDKWRDNFEKALKGKSEYPNLNELNYYIKEFNIPTEPFFDLIEAMEIDLNKNRYSTFDELKVYCYKAASTVGLMTIPILGYKNAKTKDYAINLGIALQLTNIIRDVKTDALINRVYIPQEDLQKFNYSEQEIFANTYNQNFIDLMQYQAQRAREFYKIANENVSKEDKANLFTAKAMEYIYIRLLDKIEEEKYNVYQHKIKVSFLNKILISLLVWFKYKVI
ncbi:MAG: squalene synthase HpnD [Ignavibacteriae bacterium]|nr:MAG: squalene synthase HpnD [Ignavibacteriota bacterium]